jgi:hypothetical protein
MWCPTNGIAIAFNYFSFYLKEFEMCTFRIYSGRSKLPKNTSTGPGTFSSTK